MHFLITAGGTREYIDPVRFISNASSGKMGYALARAALKAGHKVTLVTAPTALREPSGAKVVRVETAGEMFEAVKKYFARCDCLIMAAAVADYTPTHPAKTKIKKQNRSLTIKVKPTTDILKWAGKHKNRKLEIGNRKFHRRRVVVGFALEDKALRPRAEKKMMEKNLDMIVANTTAAIGAGESTVLIKTRPGDWKETGKATKSIIAAGVIHEAENLPRFRYGASLTNLQLPANQPKPRGSRISKAGPVCG